jgi:2-oxoglutarate ferredoxin oxidoreductase subunit beta
LQTTLKDWETDQEVRWCPGCGDYAILKAVQRTMPEIGAIRPTPCSFRASAAPAVFPIIWKAMASTRSTAARRLWRRGIKLANPELDVWLVTGDGDGMSIGGNHTMHLLRRNLDCQILLFNNEIYGLTKGQYSPTSRSGHQFSLRLAFGLGRSPGASPAPLRWDQARASSRAGFDVSKNLPNVLKAATPTRARPFVEIFQNCIVYNKDRVRRFRRCPRVPITAALAEERRTDAVRHRRRAAPRASPLILRADAQGRRCGRWRLAGGGRDRP